MENVSPIWKIRTVKDYKDAKTHLIVGEVITETRTWVRIEGRTYHFGKTVNRLDEIKEGEYSRRIIPWSRIEMVNELLPDFNCSKAVLKNNKNYGITLSDGKSECLLYRHFDRPTD